MRSRLRARPSSSKQASNAQGLTLAVEIALPLSAKAAQLFAEKGIENARLEAELLLAHVLGIKRLELYLQHDRPLNEAQLEQFRGFVRRRLKREPLQYIVGTQQFRELQLHVDRRALIPRPETEVLAGVVIEYARMRVQPLSAIDIGTGTGAIALSIAKECADVAVLATDVSEEALALARENAAASGITVEFAAGSLWQAVPAGRLFDIVVSNPPYVAETERSGLQPEVRDWEPAGALFAGPDGLDVVRPLIQQAAPHMTEGGLLALEVGSDQAERVRELIAVTTSYEEIRVIRDLAGRDRIVTAIRRKQAA
jgi:release factor glutamine methyltransferase